LSSDVACSILGSCSFISSTFVGSFTSSGFLSSDNPVAIFCTKFSYAVFFPFFFLFLLPLVVSFGFSSSFISSVCG
jgi:hypothetical protein